MLRKIMVPLDGSKNAEKALPFAINLAERFGATLLLLRSTEVKSLIQDSFQREIEVVNQAEAYLHSVKEMLTKPGLDTRLTGERIETIVAYGNAVEEIVELAPFEKADLIIMTTHARTGLPRLVMGSVAEGVLHATKIPVILIRPEDSQTDIPLDEVFAARAAETAPRIVVTLDGTPEAEAALQPALEIARAIQATVYLLRVEMPFVPVEYGTLIADYGLYYGSEMVEENQQRRERAYKYLDAVKTRLQEMGVKTVQVVRVGDPANEIVRHAAQIKASMLVMATHARGKIGHMLLGSVAENVMRRSHLPVLMVHSASPVNTETEQAELALK